jgi:hypothetical protein
MRASQGTCARGGHGPGSASAVQVPGGLPPAGSLATSWADGPAHCPGPTPFWGMRAAPGSRPALRANHPALYWLAHLQSTRSGKGVVKGHPREGRDALVIEQPSALPGRFGASARRGLVRNAMGLSAFPLLWGEPSRAQAALPAGRVYSDRRTWALRTLAWGLTIFARAPRHRRFLCSGCPPPDPGSRPAELPPCEAPGSSGALWPTKVGSNP